MSVQYSTALETYLAVTGSVKAALDGGFLSFYSGPVPADANAAIDAGGAKLVTLSVGGDGTTGLTFEATAPSGVLSKTGSETWSGTIAATGTATFFRFCEAGDDGTTADATKRRVQGTLGTTAASDGQLTSVSLTAAQTQTVEAFQLW